MEMLSPRGTAAPSQQAVPQQAPQATAASNDSPDDLPF